MRLRRGRDEQLPIDPELARELEAVDRALAGESVDAELATLATLTAELRDERPRTPESFGAELDRRLDSGFADPDRPAARRALSAARPSGLMAPAGALATLAIIAAIGISVARDGEGEGLLGREDAPSTELQDTVPQATGPEGGASVAEPGAVLPGGLPGSVSPSAKDAPGAATRNLRESGFSAEDADALVAPFRALERGERIARGADRRIQDRSAALTLRAETGEVREVSDQAISIVEAAGGVIASASLTEQGRTATADLDLRIPTRELDTTLDRLTDLANVRSLNEATLDITRPFVSARDALRDARAERSQLLAALGEAETGTEADALRRQLRDARRAIARREAAFENIARRARLATVTLRVEGVPDGGDGSWSLGDAADDALTTLQTIAGVLLIALAIAVPVGLLVALLAGALALTRRRLRERALDERNG